jgi:ABC-2 type transport system ATP-binding protein
MISVESVTKHYGELPAVNNLSFSVARGEILGLIGPNGAGKTTTLRMLAGVHAPSAGRVTIAGFDLLASPLEAKKHLALVPDQPELFASLTVWEHLDLAARLYRVEAWEAAGAKLLEELELEGRRDTIVAELSRGMRQKVVLACALIHSPSALLLDEPLVGLDPRGMRTLFDAVQRRAAEGAAVIMSSHVLSQVERLCTRFLILRRGTRLLCGTKREIAEQLAHRDDRASLEQLFFDATEGGAANGVDPGPRDTARNGHGSESDALGNVSRPL